MGNTGLIVVGDAYGRLRDWLDGAGGMSGL
jgi:hypothetical protein